MIFKVRSAWGSSLSQRLREKVGGVLHMPAAKWFLNVLRVKHCCTGAVQRGSIGSRHFDVP